MSSPLRSHASLPSPRKKRIFHWQTASSNKNTHITPDKGSTPKMLFCVTRPGTHLGHLSPIPPHNKHWIARCVASFPALAWVVFGTWEFPICLGGGKSRKWRLPRRAMRRIRQLVPNYHIGHVLSQLVGQFYGRSLLPNAVYVKKSTQRQKTT